MATATQLKNLAVKKGNNRPVSVSADTQMSVDNHIKKPTRIQLIALNKDTTNARKIRMFDASRIVSALIGNADASALVSPVNREALDNYLKGHKLVVDRVRAQVTKDASQFSNESVLIRGTIDGTLDKQPIFLEDAVTSDDYDPKIQTYAVDMVIDDTTAIDVMVNPGEKVVFTFYIKDVR